MQMRHALSAILLLMGLIEATNGLAQVVTIPFSPQSKPAIKPFGYGVVRQQFITAGSKTGAGWCTALWGSSWQCISVSGGNTCSGTVPTGELVSCNPTGTPAVNESAFATVSCKGQANGPVGPLGSQDWCLTAGIETSRTRDTLYLYNDYVRTGLNRRFGGTIFELYGADKKNRILQNGGGAMQLSLWGNDVSYAPAGSTLGYFQIPPSTTSCNSYVYQTQATCPLTSGNMCQEGLVGPNVSDCIHQFACIDNGFAAGGPINPIQAISAGCGYGQTSQSNDEAAITSVASSQPNVITATKSGPQQFSKSTNAQVTGLTWKQTMHVSGPFALASYNIAYNGSTNWNADFQEIPAFFTTQGMNNGYTYYYAGPNPYNDAASSVTQGNVPDSRPRYISFPTAPARSAQACPQVMAPSSRKTGLASAIRPTSGASRSFPSRRMRRISFEEKAIISILEFTVSLLFSRA